MITLRRLRCWFTRHKCRMYVDLKRISEDRVECPCCRCGKVLHAPYGLAIEAEYDWSRPVP